MIQHVGLKPRPNPFQDMRGDGERELSEAHQIYVVCPWVSNNVAIAAKYYLQVGDSDIECTASVYAAHSGEGLASDSRAPTEGWSRLVLEQVTRHAQEGGSGSLRRAID